MSDHERIRTDLDRARGLGAATFTVYVTSVLALLDERDALAAEADRLRLALGSVLRYADEHRISRPDEHDHDCYELWCIERDHARILLDRVKP